MRGARARELALTVGMGPVGADSCPFCELLRSARSAISREEFVSAQKFAK
jgi:hypothetical protein